MMKGKQAGIIKLIVSTNILGIIGNNLSSKRQFTEKTPSDQLMIAIVRILGKLLCLCQRISGLLTDTLRVFGHRSSPSHGTDMRDIRHISLLRGSSGLLAGILDRAPCFQGIVLGLLGLLLRLPGLLLRLRGLFSCFLGIFFGQADFRT